MDDGGAACVRAIMHWHYRTICRGKTSILRNLNDRLGPEMHNYISFYGLRAFGRLSDGGPVVSIQVCSFLCFSTFSLDFYPSIFQIFFSNFLCMQVFDTI